MWKGELSLCHVFLALGEKSFRSSLNFEGNVLITSFNRPDWVMDFMLLNSVSA